MTICWLDCSAPSRVRLLTGFVVATRRNSTAVSRCCAMSEVASTRWRPCRRRNCFSGAIKSHGAGIPRSRASSLPLTRSRTTRRVGRAWRCGSSNERPTRLLCCNSLSANSYRPDGALPLAAIVEANATLLDQLDEFPTLRDAVAQEKERLQEWIKGERGREAASDRERGERFE